jgi:hypothetical protein
LALKDADQVLVVAAEELDWILLEAHGNWRLTPGDHRRGALLAEGAAAVLLTRESVPVSVRTSSGQSFVGREEAGGAIAAAVGEFADVGAIDFVISGANDTWADDLLADAISRSAFVAGAPVVLPKRHLGEALGAGALIQIVLAAAALADAKGKRALVASLGWNQQAAAALVERAVNVG